MTKEVNFALYINWWIYFDWFSNFELVNIKDIKIDLNWVYGIRCIDVLDSFAYFKRYVCITKFQFQICSSISFFVELFSSFPKFVSNPFSEENSTDECLIYYTACIVIVYYYKLNEQRHYIEHEVSLKPLLQTYELSIINFFSPMCAA